MYADSRKVPATNIFEIFKKTGNTFNARPQLLVFILPGKMIQPYYDIKAYCDVQIGIPSQCRPFSDVF